jgi:hypothetical protein
MPSRQQQRLLGRAGWKRERVSESERHGTVKLTFAALLTRRGLPPRGRWGLRQRLSTVATNPAGLASRTPSLVRVTLSELGQVPPRSAARPRCRPARRSTESQPARAGPPRIVDQAKARGNARDTGGVPGCHPTELNSTTAEEVKVLVTDDGESRKA